MRCVLTAFSLSWSLLGPPQSSLKNPWGIISMKFCFPVLLALSLCTFVGGQEHAVHARVKPATLMSGLGDLHHPVSTKKPQAQQFFDQGLRLIYAFNHEEAARAFHRAADLDPRLAIAY